MSREKFDDECPDCRPAILDRRTGKVLDDSSWEMQAVNKLWAETTLEQREAYHRVMCSNSRDEKDLALVDPFLASVQRALSS